MFDTEKPVHLCISRQCSSSKMMLALGYASTVLLLSHSIGTSGQRPCLVESPILELNPCLAFLFMESQWQLYSICGRKM